MRHASLLLIATLTACTGPATEPDPIDSDDPGAVPLGPADALGPWSIGTELDEVAARSGETLPTQVWWPSHDASGAPYSYEGLLTADAVGSASTACATPRPVVLFSHGNEGVRYQSVFLTEHLASHGYIVAAPDHVGNTTTDPSIPHEEVALRRPHDISDVFDHLVARSDDPSDSLAGCIDAEAGFAVIGHSFGGWTTLAVAGAPIDLDGLTATCDVGYDWMCGLEDNWAAAYPGDDSGDLSDDRVWAAIALAPIGFGSLGGTASAIDVPTLIIGGRDDYLTPWDVEVKPLYESLSVETRGLAGIFDAGHYHFTDFCIEGLFPGCGGDALPTEDAHVYIETLATAWLRLASGQGDYAEYLPPDDDGLSWKSPDLPPEP